MKKALIAFLFLPTLALADVTVQGRGSVAVLDGATKESKAYALEKARALAFADAKSNAESLIKVAGLSATEESEKKAVFHLTVAKIRETISEAGNPQPLKMLLYADPSGGTVPKAIVAFPDKNAAKPGHVAILLEVTFEIAAKKPVKK
jgi:hypothetical protein